MISKMSKKESIASGSSMESSTGVITELGYNDVLLGRGAASINYVGNVIFREIVKEKRVEYLSTARRQTKDDIAKSIIDIVRSRNGRFLRKVPGDQIAWVAVENERIIEKVKQSLRDKEYSPEEKVAPQRSSKIRVMSKRKLTVVKDSDCMIAPVPSFNPSMTGITSCGIEMPVDWISTAWAVSNKSFLEDSKTESF